MSLNTGRTTGTIGRMLAGLLAVTATLALSPLLYTAHEARAADESETDLAKKTQNPAAAPLCPPLAREPVATQDGPGHRAIAVLTLTFAPVPRAVPGLRLGIRRAGRMSPTRVARRGSRGRSVCPSYALSFWQPRFCGDPDIL